LFVDLRERELGWSAEEKVEVLELCVYPDISTLSALSERELLRLLYVLSCARLLRPSASALDDELFDALSAYSKAREHTDKDRERSATFTPAKHIITDRFSGLKRIYNGRI
jgi:hypothetical protein